MPFLKTTITISLFIFLYSCNITKKKDNNFIENSKVWSVQLNNKLGLFKIELPKQFDTLFSWTQYSDCGEPCAISDYRIQNSDLPIFKESGFIYYSPKDSVEQFTLKHSKPAKPWPFADTIMVNMYRDYLKSQAFENTTNKYRIDTLLTIHRHKYAVIGFTTIDTTKKVEVNILMAATSIQGNRIEIYFEKRNKKSTTSDKDFLDDSFKNLMTTKIFE